MARHYDDERTGQIEFFDNFRIDYENEPVLIDNTDGIYNGNIFEFKLNISNINKTLFQAIKYLSKMRIKGESVPANILLVDLNKAELYLFHSQDYFDAIHKVYIGSASMDNEGFVGGEPVSVYRYFDNTADTIEVLNLLKETNYMPIAINEDCIVGWAERYYRELPKANKGDFLGDDTGTSVKIIGEIREPKHFKGLILPYTGKTNEKFKYLMDKLNDRLKKKDLGAFYTPKAYAEKACELVKMAIDRVPTGNDYIILDRCAGTGSLEQAIIDVLGDEVASHIICSTYEYYEYKVLLERIGDKVRFVVPPTEAQVEYSNGCIANADAMSVEYINNLDIKRYVDNPKCSVILFENPPYRDVVGSNMDNKKSNTAQSFVFNDLKSNLFTLPNSNVSTARDISNQFIWSGYKFYLRQPTDSYVVFSPIKYWKSLGLSNKQIIDGYLFNRKYFHATTASAISCICWSNVDNDDDAVILKTYDIIDEELVYIRDTTIRQARSTFESYFDRRMFASDIETPVYSEGNGTPTDKTIRKCDGKSYCGDTIIGYLQPIGFSIDAKHINLLRMTYFGIRGFYLRNDNYLIKLPLFVAKQYSQKNWYDRDIYFTTSDGGDAYTKDDDFLKSCLIYTCLSNQNKCLSFDGSDGRRYQNELCFDNSKTWNTMNMPAPLALTEQLPLALKDLTKYAIHSDKHLDDDEKELLGIWQKILAQTWLRPNYNKEFNYGVYQITKEIDTFHMEGIGTKQRKVFDNPILHGDLETLRTKLKEYYKTHITDKMFKYELLK